MKLMVKCDAATILKQNGLKLTQQRLLVTKTIIESDKIFSANSLLDKIENNMDLVTIYRILSALLKKEIIREIVSNETTRFYELSCIHNPVHPHFTCNKCKKIFCLNAIDNKDIDKLKNYAKDKYVDDVIIQFTGTCEQCK